MSPRSVQPSNRRERSGRRATAARRSHGLQFRVSFEQLESRRLLSASPTPTVAPPSSAALSSAAHTNVVVYTPAGVINPALGTADPTGLTPSQVRNAYGFSQVTFSSGSIVGNGAGQTIAIVDAFDDPNILSDVQAFSTQFGLLQFNTTGGPTFQKVSQTGSTTNLPPADSPGSSSWDLEESLDVEWAHAMAPGANIVLVEANSTADLYTAVAYAKTLTNVSVISMSFSGGETTGETTADTTTFAQPSDHNVTFLAATGDDGANGRDFPSTGTGYPAYSPNVVAVGGTTLSVDSSGDYLGESGWSDSGGGISAVESQPSYQTGVVTQSTSFRTTPDVSFDASPSTGVSVYDTYDTNSGTPWVTVGGTSLSSPSWAGLIAVANQGRSIAHLSALTSTQTLTSLYSMSASDFNDITSGNNGGGNSLYSAGTGYDLVTGRGTPKVPLVVNDLIGAFTVLSSAPAAGSIVTSPPTSYIVNFSNAYATAGLSASILTVNGIAATSFIQTVPRRRSRSNSPPARSRPRESKRFRSPPARCCGSPTAARWRPTMPRSSMTRSRKSPSLRRRRPARNSPPAAHVARGQLQ